MHNVRQGTKLQSPYLLVAQDPDACFPKGVDGVLDLVEPEDQDGVSLALLDKSIHVFHVDIFSLECAQDPRKTTGSVGNFHGNDLVLTYGKAVVLQKFFRFFNVIDDEPQDTEIRGIGQGERPDVDPVFSEDIGHFGKTSRFVFDEYRDLLDLQEFLLSSCI